MENYGGDWGSQRESQGEWSQNSKCMQEMAALIFKPHYSISELLQRPSLLPSSFSGIPPPLPFLSTGIFESKEEVGKKEMVGKKRGRITKEEAKKVKKADVIEVVESDEDETGRVKWKDFEVHRFIAIRGEMEEEFAKSVNKQSIFFKKYIFIEQK
jgi:hypothetical protein